MAFSSAPGVLEYDVFLSFRGEDTRKTFVSHLYLALDSKCIATFKDDQKLEIGDHISDKLRRAIESSRFAVVVLSENYATSRWCLMELHLIMERMRHGKLDVFPVFYKVDPSAVRHQRGSFALEKYQSPEMADTVSKWGEALNLIASLSGVDSRNCIDEAIMVKEIVRDIARRVTLMQKIDSKNIFGMKAQMEGLIPLLDLESDEVRMIGIWGMGGIGKTTIAKCLYDQISSNFTALCFIENIKSIRKDHGKDLMHLQKLVLCSILHDDIRVWSVEAGYRMIKDKLWHHKVLFVLDGIDKVEQVHALAKETSWFGPGSRIIITTRDRGLLNRCGVKTVYKVKCLDGEDSLQMFNHNAFGEGLLPPDGFEQLSVRASRLAHGLPSALQAYALFLRGWTATPEKWEEALRAVESSLDENVMEILKTSYEDLLKPQQNVLLHVACLFNGDTLERITSLLDGSIPERSLGIRGLAEKSLIKISTNRYVTMPKLVEQMGREIMRNSRKYLGDPVEICDALAIRKGTEQTEFMSLHTCEMTCPLSMKTSVVDRMHNLKFLKVHKHVDCRESKLQLTQDAHDLTCTLRLLHWDTFPLRTLPFRLDPYFLVELNLRHSNLETLWSGTQVFKNLRRLDVTGSKYLKRLPDISSIRSLEELFLEQCTRLEGIPECIGNRSTLKKLKLSYCGGNKSPLHVVVWKLTEQQPIRLEFPDLDIKMINLINISIEGKIKFVFFPYFQGDAEYISINSEQQIPITLATRVQQTPQYISEFNKLNHLISITRSSHRDNSRPLTFDRFPEFPNLKELKLVNLNVPKIPDGICRLEFIEKLDLSGNDFESLPEAMNSLSWLRTLSLRNCFKLKDLPKLTQVQTLTLTNCRNLRSLVKLSDTNKDHGRYCLLEVCLENCKKVVSLSDELTHFTELTYLDISGHDFETLPSSIRDLTSLVTLCLNNCKKLKSVENLPQSLQFLDAHCCDSLEADSVQHFKDRLNAKVQPQIECFQETEILSFELNHQTTMTGCDSHEVDFLDYKYRQFEEVQLRNDHFQETETLTNVPNHHTTMTGCDSLEAASKDLKEEVQVQLKIDHLQEPKMLPNHHTTMTGCDSLHAASKDRVKEEVQLRNYHFQETEMLREYHFTMAGCFFDLEDRQFEEAQLQNYHFQETEMLWEHHTTMAGCFLDSEARQFEETLDGCYDIQNYNTYRQLEELQNDYFQETEMLSYVPKYHNKTTGYFLEVDSDSEEYSEDRQCEEVPNLHDNTTMIACESLAFYVLVKISLMLLVKRIAKTDRTKK